MDKFWIRTQWMRGLNYRRRTIPDPLDYIVRTTTLENSVLEHYFLELPQILGPHMIVGQEAVPATGPASLQKLASQIFVVHVLTFFHLVHQ
uniref:Uncharacterized protein n=1 Tax=Romanomermis culicivorax TaxID=13658 RepID=A0A915JPM9_ROMCU